VDHDGAGATRGELAAVVAFFLLDCAGVGLGWRSGADDKLLFGLLAVSSLLDRLLLGRFLSLLCRLLALGLLLLDSSCGSILGAVLEVELLGQLEVKLDGGALELTSERIGDGDIDLRTVESAITRVELPLGASGLLELVKSLGELSLGALPGGNVDSFILKVKPNRP
jgi:hypothetical protein